MKRKRYIISGNSRDGYSILDTHAPGMPAVEKVSVRWVAVERIRTFYNVRKKDEDKP